MAIFLEILFLILGFAMLIKGADWFVDGASGLATRMRIPQIVIGLTIVAFGTSAPEAAVSITAAITGGAEMSVSNVVGSNILNILLILGMAAVIRPVAVQKNTIRYEIPFLILISIAFVLMGYFDGAIQWWDGLVLCVLFCVFMAYLVLTSIKMRSTQDTANLLSEQTALSETTAADTAAEPSDSESDAPKGWAKVKAGYESLKGRMWFLVFLTLVGLGIVVCGSTFCVGAAKMLAQAAGVSEYVIGLTVVAFGTSLPELVTSVVAGIKGNSDIAVGNIIGSNIFNLLFVLGISSLIAPLPFAAGYLWDSIVAIAACAVLGVLVLLPRHRVDRIGGGIMLAGFIAYYIWLFVG